MEHRTAREQQWQPAPEEHFTGRTWFGPMVPPDLALNVLEVLFEPGARTDWHTHPDGQALYVVSGSGRVQTQDGEAVRIGPGDVVYSPPGEVHWHGAGTDGPMVHFSLTGASPTEWVGRKVTDEEYASS